MHCTSQNKLKLSVVILQKNVFLSHHLKMGTGPCHCDQQQTAKVMTEEVQRIGMETYRSRQ